MAKASIYFVLSLILVAGLLWSCGGASSPAADSPALSKPSKPAAEPPLPPAAQPSATASRVDIVYFHSKVRCAACLSVELRTQAVINDYFKDTVDSGKLTFQAYVLQDKQNRSVVSKYGAVSSQLFITTVKNGVENIKHIEEVWMPSC